MINKLLVPMILLLATGCATSRGILDVQVQIPVNPDASRAVVIRNVADNRGFELAPSSADIPSLKDGDIENTAITSRAIARKRNGFGAALGDILLPEGRAVADLVRETLTKTFREQGYAVYSANDLNAAGALELDVDVDKFWAWFRPGFARIAMEFASTIVITPHPVTGTGVMEINGESRVQGQVANTSNWLETIETGLQSLMDDMQAQLNAQ